MTNHNFLSVLHPGLGGVNSKLVHASLDTVLKRCCFTKKTFFM